LITKRPCDLPTSNLCDLIGGVMEDVSRLLGRRHHLLARSGDAPSSCRRGANAPPGSRPIAKTRQVSLLQGHRRLLGSRDSARSTGSRREEYGCPQGSDPGRKPSFAPSSDCSGAGEPPHDLIRIPRELGVNVEKSPTLQSHASCASAICGLAVDDVSLSVDARISCVRSTSFWSNSALLAAISFFIRRSSFKIVANGSADL
jgi:hypothetical protein